MNKKILQSWVDQGWAVHDLGDGAWSWTGQAKRIPAPVRTILSDLLYGTCETYLVQLFVQELHDFGFDSKGFAFPEKRGWK